MMRMKITGLKKLERKCADLGRRARRVHGEHNIPIKDLLAPKFLHKCSRFKSADELFDASGFTVESNEDFAAIPDAEWDAFICKSTSYANWQDMLGAAATEWTSRELGF
jgi:hypothetical protein